MTTNQDESLPIVYFRSLGTGALAIGHPSLELPKRNEWDGSFPENATVVTKWDGKLPEQMTYYLLTQGYTTRDEIFEAFWPALSVREATNVFHVTKHKVTETLRNGSDGLLTGTLTEYAGGAYWLTAQHPRALSLRRRFVGVTVLIPVPEHFVLYWDAMVVYEAREAWVRGTLSNAELEFALSLNKGSFLSGMDSEWVLRQRQILNEMLADLSMVAALRTEDWENRSQYAATALQLNPLNEQALRVQLLSLVELSRPEDAQVLYQEFLSRLQTKGSLPVSAETAKLVSDLFRKRRKK